jgi:hypothetical protein
LVRDPILRAAIHACSELSTLEAGGDGDPWPRPEHVVRFAEAYQVPPGVLGSYFGLLLVTDGSGRERWIDVARGQSPGVDGPLPFVEYDTEIGYACFAGFRRALGHPVPRLPLNGYTAELPVRRRANLRLIG